MITTIIKKSDFQRFRIFGNKVLICINEREDENFITCDEFVCPCFNRGIVISNLIKANYPSDRMDAIRNNYELVRDGAAGDKTEEYTQEYNDMQAWRAEAKRLANEIMEEYNKDEES